MERKESPVNQKRRYDSTRRRLQASQTRMAILEAARRLFLRDGFTQTTIAAIAAEVGVSADTIYKTFRGKPGLVRAICDEALGGDGPIPAGVRSDALQAEERDPRKIIRGWGTLTTEVSPRVSPILLLVRDAAGTDPVMARLKADLDMQRLERMTHNAHNLAAAGHLRPEFSEEAAGEIMWTYSSPELFELLVLIRGWPLERYGAFIAEAMIAALLAPATPNSGSSSRR